MTRRPLLAGLAVLAVAVLLTATYRRQPPAGPPPVRAALAAAKARPAAPAPVAAPAVPAPAPPADAAAAVLAAFDAWTRGAATDVAEGVALATARRGTLRELIQADPARALAAAVPWAVRQGLPAAVQALLEEPVALTGELHVLCPRQEFPWRRGAQGMIREFTAGERRWHAFVYGRRLGQMSARTLAIHGVAVDDVLAIHEDAVRVLEPAEAAARTAAGEAAADAPCALTGVVPAAAARTVAAHGGRLLVLAGPGAAGEFRRRVGLAEEGFLRPNEPPVSPVWAHGAKTLLFMRIRFADDPREPITESEAAAVMSEANDYFVRASYNTFSIATTVGPLVTLPHPKIFYAAVGPIPLLAHARAATLAAGYDFTAYDLDLVRHETVPGFDWGGLGYVGGRGAWLQGSSLGVIVHELGHNLGLGHANFWQTTRPLPPDPDEGVPFDGTSRVGYDSVFGPGDDDAYGDPFDVMGGGPVPAGEYNAVHKTLLSWIPANNVVTVRSNGTYRLHAHDTGRSPGGLNYALRVRKAGEPDYGALFDPDATPTPLIPRRGEHSRNYWLSVRADPLFNLLQPPGVEVLWSQWEQANGTSHLLDTTPGTPGERLDAWLSVGRTLADPEAQIFITPVRAVGFDATGIPTTNDPADPGRLPEPPYLDVVVNLGPFPSNRPPSLTLAASRLTVAPGAPVTFTATAGDADGDAVAYSWTFGDETTGENRPEMTRSWGAPGDYVVRCEVTDMKGGLASRHVVVRVGAVNTLRITGRVVDGDGQPLAGVWVHNGLEDTNTLYSADYRHAFTDSDGAYTLTGLTNAPYDVGAFIPGHHTEPLNFTQPLQLNEFNGTGVDFIAVPQPRVTVAATAHGAEAGPAPSVFRITRDGPTNDTLRVFFTLTGAAVEGEDYEAWPDFEIQTNNVITPFGPSASLLLFNYVDIPPGADGADVSLATLADDLAEGPENLRLTLAYPVGFLVTNDMATNWFDIPGWERRLERGVERWYQTRPRYRLGHPAEGTAVLADATPPTNALVSLFAMDAATTEGDQDSAVVSLFRLAASYAEELPVTLTLDGTATPGVDYAPFATNVVIPAGQEFILLHIRALADAQVEGNETVVLRIAPGPGYAVAAGEAVVQIVDNDLPVVTAHAVAARAAERGAPGAVRFQRAGDLTQPLLVDYLVTGTATPGLDFPTLPGQVVIPAGSAAATVPVPVLDDTLLEGDETIILTVSDSPLYNLGNPARAVITIVDDETPTVTVVATDAAAEESGDTGEFTITRTGPLSQALRVRYRFSGTARHLSDFVASGDEILLPAGAATATLLITPLQDGFREDDENIVLELLPDPAYQIGIPAQAEVLLTDDDDGAQPGVGFALLRSSAPESAGEVFIAIQVSANPQEGDGNAITVRHEVLGGTATPDADYVLAAGTNVFAYLDPDSPEPLTNRVAIIPLLLIDDALREPDETIVLRLTVIGTPQGDGGGGGGGTIGTPIDIDDDGIPDGCDTDGDGVIDLPGQDCPVDTNAPPPTLQTNGFYDVFAIHTFTILDDDRSLVSLEASTNRLVEGGPAGALRIRRVGETNAPQTVILHFHGSAVAGGDVAALPNFVTLPAGVAEVSLPLIPLDDPEQEYTEQLVITLVSAPGSTIAGDGFVVVTIEDNDGTIEFASPRYAADEGDGAAEISVRRTGDASGTAIVAYEAVAGTAVPGVAERPQVGDFIPVRGELEFLPGETLKTFAVPLLDDAVPDGPRTVLLRLTRGTGLFPLGGQNTAVLTIRDDDGGALIPPTGGQDAGYESSGGLLLGVARLGPVDAALTLNYATRDATALAGADYVAASGVVVFPPGEAVATVPLTFLDDALVEGDETFEVVFTDEFGNEAGVLTATILDDDTEVQFAAAAHSVGEDAGVVELHVTRRGLTAQPLLVDYASANVTAVAGLDYEAAAGTLRFEGGRLQALTNGTGIVELVPGETNLVLTVRILNDALGERDETFTVTLANLRFAEQPLPGSLVLGSNATTVVTILDNEIPGGVDEAFNAGLGADGPVRALAHQPDGRVLLGGDFGAVNGTFLPRVARLHADGLLDRSFNPGRGLDAAVLALALLPDGRLLVGGAFTNAAGIRRPHLVRLEADGTPPAGTNVPAPNATVRALAARPDGAAYLGGDFTAVGGQPRGGVARLLPDGALDPAFLPGGAPGGAVNAVAADAQGRVLVGGAFQNFNRSGFDRLVRLLPDGTVDPAWLPGAAPDGPVLGLAVAADGRLLVAGAFTAVGGLPRAGVARLTEDGALDLTFDPVTGPDAAVNAVAAGPAGTVLLGGAFTAVGETLLGGYARLLADGALDPDFTGPGANGPVLAVAPRSDGAFYIGGAFTEVNGLARRRVARIHGDEKLPASQLLFSAPVYEVGEAAGEVTVTVVRTGTVKEPASVAYFTVPGTATAPADFTASAGTLNFAAGVTNLTFKVAIAADTLAEGDERFGLVLTNAVGAAVGRRGTAEVIILDDELGVAFEAAAVSVSEDGTNAVLVVRRSGDLSAAARADFATADGTARAGEDYVALAGAVEFPAGAATAEIRVALVDDDVLEPAETFTVTLTGAAPPYLVGTVREAVVTILDNDTPPTSWLLTVQPAEGGAVAPAGGRFPTNAVVALTATPQRGYEFIQWEGTVAATDNPLALLMDRNHVLTARFRPRDYLETFESGTFTALPWRFAGNAPWTLTTNTAGAGRWSARSGVIGHGQTSTLVLERETGAGAGIFDLRVSSEADWDHLEFWVDGVHQAKWAGEVPWQSHAFFVTAGPHRFEWRYAKDRNFVAGLDAAWIDNLDLPEPAPAVTGPPPAPTLALMPKAGGGMLVKVLGEAGRRYTLEASADMRTWQPVAEQVMSGALLFLEDAAAAGRPLRFYRATVR